ncbi:MAG: hypothetical protein RLZZ630_670 [Bacteroidota bacterium]|jgi:Fic family protein
MTYSWQQKDWTKFTYSPDGLDEKLMAFVAESAHLVGMSRALPEAVQTDTLLAMMLAEAMKTSEIEGEVLSRPDVLSSIRNNLGLNERIEKVKDKRAQGIGELMVVVRRNYAKPISDAMLFKWHSILMRYNSRIQSGVWRSHKEPMRVVSGTIGKEKVHFEAPPSSRVPAEMKKFITWFNNTAPGGKKEIKNAPLRAAIAHLYFESIHPFEDGNGRIGRAIAEKALAQTAGGPLLMSLSQVIEGKRKVYYSALETAQKSNDITEWVNYFVSVVLEAIKRAKKTIDFTLRKSRFFDRYNNQLNVRQVKVVRRMMDAEPEGFVGGMTARKYVSITKTSKATATRDLQALFDLGVLISEGSGRSVQYRLNL